MNRKFIAAAIMNTLLIFAFFLQQPMQMIALSAERLMVYILWKKKIL